MNTMQEFRDGMVATNTDPGAVLRWLSCAVGDFRAAPITALFYGFGFFVVSWLVIGFLWLTGLEWMIFPAVAGALLVGPFLAVGLYHESRRIAGYGGVGIASPGQIALVGTILMVLLLAWFRAATILYALLFGLKPFPGLPDLLVQLFRTPEGISLLVIGSAVGGLFAACCFAISIYSIPMLVDRKVDAFTAMGMSFAKAARFPRLTIAWGAVVTVLAAFGFATLMLGMIVIFPILGFATWHAYASMFGTPD